MLIFKRSGGKPMRKIWLSLLCLILSGLVVLPLAFAQDPTGAATLEANPQASIDYVWVLVCGFLVMFMQAGLRWLRLVLPGKERY